jgi:undecaprenyl-diphosphatase
MEWFESLVLGVVQGITEFLPVSSDGHLSITQHLFGWLTGTPKSGEENLFFDVMLHLGTLAAIVYFYRGAVLKGVRGLLGDTEIPESYRRGSVIRTGLLAAVATSPLVPFALFFKDRVEELFQSAAAAAYGFLITATVLLVLSRLRAADPGKGPAETTWLDALLIGLAQMFAPLPGVSRSGLTIAAALGLGLSRTWAVGFSLLIAVPAILGAAVFEIKDVQTELLTGERIAQTVAATVLAGFVGYAAIVWLIKVVRSGKLWYFSVYLVLLATVVLTLLARGGSVGGSTDGRGVEAGENTLDGSARRASARAGDSASHPRFVEPLGRSLNGRS